MIRTLKVSVLLTFAPIIFGCSTSVRDAAAPTRIDEPRGLTCENARMKRFATNPRDCIERGGVLL